MNLPVPDTGFIPPAYCPRCLEKWYGRLKHEVVSIHPECLAVLQPLESARPDASPRWAA